jgi:hypothetical protein
MTRSTTLHACRRPGRPRHLLAEAEMLEAMATQIDLAMLVEGALVVPFEHLPHSNGSTLSC